QLKALPVQELQDIVNLQAGVVDGHFRGGRIGEVQFQVDGVSVNNAYDNASSLRLDRSLIEEVQVISGTFDAEYGQAMSGVVNAILRRGTEKFRWDAEALGGGYSYDPGRRSVLPWFHDSRPAGTSSFQASLSGPTGVPRTYFLLNGRHAESNDYLSALREFRPTDRIINGQMPTGDFGSEPLGYNREWSGVAKITNRSLPGVEVSYQGIANLIAHRNANFGYRYDPEGMTRQRTFSIVHGLDWTHTLSKSTFYSVSLRHNWFDYRDMAYDDVWDPRYDAAGPPKGFSDWNHGAIVQGVDLTRNHQRTSTVVWKNSLVSQVTRDQQIKVGAEFSWPHLSFGDDGHLSEVEGGVLHREVNNLPRFPSLTFYKPYTAAAFAQEDLEWNDLRIRAGLRFEYFNARAALPSDLENPANSIAGAPESRLVPTTRKHSLAPRLGVSYPVTRDAALFFAYGHFYQMPSLKDVFTNADYRVLTELQSSSTSYSVMGNPDIQPEETVQYQFGYKQAVTEWLGVDLNLFYKDIRNLLGVEFITTYNDAEYPRMTNVDFGDVVGFTVSLEQRRRGLFSTALDYTWQRAQGNSSDPRETATRASAGKDPRPRTIPFNWDQRHTLNLTVEASKPRVFSLAAVTRVVSGQPYTPADVAGLSVGLGDNAGRKPAGVLMDLRGEKNLPAGATLFVRAFNVFDGRFFNGFVFTDTGSPDYSRDTSSPALADPTRYYAPRRIEVGVTMSFGAQGAS
ncbi:MAG: TonB-dependent receptor plug domain-containing protein, partial [Hyphomicrobiales bacterium]